MILANTYNTSVLFTFSVKYLYLVPFFFIKCFVNDL